MIALTQQEQTILSLIEPLADGLGMEVVRVRLMGGKRPTLQVMAEKAGGAPTSVDACADLSHATTPVLEAADPISDPYRLEVSTPGIDRPLTRPGDFGRWAGHLVKVELAMPIDGRRRFKGVIEREDENGVAIALEDVEGELVAKVNEMSKASLIPTDELIEATKASGGLPPQPDDENFSGLDVDEAEDSDNEDNNEEDSGALR